MSSRLQGNDDPGPTAVTPWYVEAFRSDYRALYAHRDLPSARREVEWLAAEILGDVRGPVLDDCCGFGRHALALGERGLDVVGIDLSLELLRSSAELEGAERFLAGRLAQADMRALPFPGGTFGAVVNLFTSFGYLGDEGDARALAEMARVLRPGGTLVMDLMNPARIRAGLVPHTVEERDGCTLESRRSLEEGGRRVVKEVAFTGPGGQRRTWRESVRMFEAAEMDERLRRAGLEPLARAGDFSGAPYDASASERQIVVARHDAAG